MQMNEPGTPPARELDIDQIRKILPHRPPFLMLDRLTDINGSESAVGWKAVTINEPHFVGHFPDYPVMPGVLIIEALAQAAVALVWSASGHTAANAIVYFMSIEKARFRRPVRPGDMLRLPVKMVRRRGPVWRFEGKAYVGDKLCAEAEYTAKMFENGGETDGDDAGT
jgi:3-hydroxyacyl-[acyl-carrier-protein] dehydratase